MMKALHVWVMVLMIGMVMTSCGNAETDAKIDQETPVASQQESKGGDANNAENTAPTNQETQTAAEKLKNQQSASKKGGGVTFENRKDMPGGISVEKTERTPESPVNDDSVDYRKLAKQICQCSSKYVGKDDGQEGDVMVSSDDKEYKEVVDCSMRHKNNMSTEPISRQALVRAIKAECHNIPGKLVMSLMMVLEKEARGE